MKQSSLDTKALSQKSQQREISGLPEQSSKEQLQADKVVCSGNRRASHMKQELTNKIISQKEIIEKKLLFYLQKMQVCNQFFLTQQLEQKKLGSSL